MEQSARSQIKTIIGSRINLVILGLLLSVVFLALSSWRIDWHLVTKVCTQLNWFPWLPLAITSYIAGILLRGYRLQLLVGKESALSMSTATNVVAVGYAVNNVLPARLGEFARAGMLKEVTGISYVHALVITFIERLLDGLLILLLFVTASSLLPVPNWMLGTCYLASITLFVATFALAITVACPQFMLAFVSRTTIRLSRRMHERALLVFSQVQRGVACLRTAKLALAAMAISLLVWLTESLFFMLMLPCFGFTPNPLKAIFIMAFTNLGILVPSSPGYIGTYHFSCVEAVKAAFPNALTTAASLTSSDTVVFSYALVVHLIFYVTVSVWGFAALSFYGAALFNILSLSWQAKHIPNLLAQRPAHERADKQDKQIKVTTYDAPKRHDEATFRSASRTLPSTFWRRLCESFLPLYAMQLEPVETDRILNNVASFVERQLGCLPVYLRVMLTCGLVGFRCVILCINLRDFSQLPLGRRQEIAEWWAHGPVPIGRKLFRPIRSLTVLAFYEDKAVKAKLDQQSTLANQALANQTLIGLIESDSRELATR